MALPTTRDETEHDVIADGQVGDAGAECDDFACSLVSADDGHRARHVTGEHVLIRMA